MPERKVLRDTRNATIMNALRSDLPLSYQQRIPEATQGSVKQTAELLFSSGNRAYLNEFVDALVNRIGRVIGQNLIWSNPLAVFKEGSMTFGSTVEEYQVGLVQAHTYDPDRDYMERALFGQELPPVKSIFHTVNRQNYYKITINESMLRRAFLEESGLSSFVNDLMAAPTSSDAVDEYKLMTRLIPQYEELGGYFKVQVPDVAAMSSTEAQAKTALRKLRTVAANLAFPSNVYNASGMTTFAKADDLVLITTPEFQSAVDVNALAAAFNVDYAKFATRTVIIPQVDFGISGAQALLTTRNFFRVYDTLIENTSQPNAVGLYNNYFLHHHSVISASRFVPAILFGDFADSEVINVTVQVTAVGKPTATDSGGTTVTKVKPGDVVQLAATVTPANASTDSVRFTVTGAASGATYVSPSGVLHVGRDETATSLSIKGISTDRFSGQPNAAVPPSAALSLAVEGDTVPDWPVVDPVPPAAQGG